VAFAWGLADIYAADPRRTMNAWYRTGVQPNAEEWERVYQGLLRALALDPYNPYLVNDMGRTHDWRVLREVAANPNARMVRTQALQHYRRSIRLRPVWPHTWASLALVKYRLRELDEEFEQALRNATHFGPWEPVVQRIVAEVGLAAWRELSEEGRRIVVQNLERSLVWQTPAIVKAAQRLGRMPLLCATVKRLEVLQPYCEPAKTG